MKIVVIGGGIFGVTTALKLSNKYDVTLVDSNDSIMNNASKCNHNRLHFGYHYPRSYKTAKQSLEGYKLFKNKFNNSILTNFPNYYLIENNSKVTPDEYELFCNNLNLDFTNKIPDINMDFENIGLSLLTKEPIYDFESIKKNLSEKLTNSNVNVIFNKTIKTKDELEDYDIIINMTYNNINKINSLFHIPPVKLKLQDVIVPIFKSNMSKIGLTIMDGPFCSVLPKGFDDKTFLLYNVKHSVIREIEGLYVPDEWLNNMDINNEIDTIYKESSKYFTFLKKSERVGYWRTFRALPINDDDERLSSLMINKVGDRVVISLLSGKVTTCWLMANKIFNIINEKTKTFNEDIINR